MSNLLNLQNQFQDFLLNENESFKAMVVSTEKVPAEVRLEIYSHAYQSRLIDALTSNFPVLYEFLGTELFEEIASEYVKQFPSCNKSIRWFGHQFANFLNAHSEYQDYPYLSELAEFEWLHTLTFDAADAPILQLDELKNIAPDSWQDMHFKPHPSLQLVRLQWNVVQLWQAITAEEAVVEPSKNTLPLTWAIWRSDYFNQFYSLANDESQALEAILNGNSFGEMCELVCQAIGEEQAGLRAAALLSAWVQSGLFSEVSLNSFRT